MVQLDDSFSNKKVKELHALEEERFIQNNAALQGYPYVNLKTVPINPEAMVILGENDARKYSSIVFDEKQKNLSVATLKPNSPEVLELVNKLESQQYQVRLFMCSQAGLDYAWERYKDVKGATAETMGVLEVDTKTMQDLISKIKHYSDIKNLLQEIDGRNNTRRISDTLSLIFSGALSLNASDIHIEPEDGAVRLRYRLDGVLHDIVDVDSYIYKRLISRLKLLSGMVLNVKVEAQDGRFTFGFADHEVEVRSSVIPGAFGESIVMRILDPTVAGFTLDKIQLNTQMDTALRQQLKRPNGLIITTGPTGSGKTTALYACLREVHNESKKIITIENPVEYKIDGIVHTQTDDNYTFASGLRAVLRQDPDVIMVGEIRDYEVAETAIHAAQTGHLVFSTLHTNSAIGAFPRLIDLGVDPKILGPSINLIMGQRLVRVLCTKCKLAYTPTPEEIELLKYVMSTHPFPREITPNTKIHRAVGCEECGGIGFKGRTGIFEGIVMDDAVEEAIIRDPRESVIYEAAKPQKIPTMLHDGMDKIIDGITSLVELERVIEFPSGFEIKKQSDVTTTVVDEDTTLAEDIVSSHIV